MLDETQLKRLRWRCAERSMREMDMLLGPFFETQFRALSIEEQTLFAALAEKDDPTLWAMIRGKTAVTPAEAALLAKICAAKIM